MHIFTGGLVGKRAISYRGCTRVVFLSSLLITSKYTITAFGLWVQGVHQVDFRCPQNKIDPHRITAFPY